jgi:phosphoesterase RecJ-like protein
MLDLYSKIQEALDANHHFTILGHIRPDGDAYGSALALALCLKSMKKNVDIFFQDGINQTYRFLQQSELIQTTPPTPPCDQTTIISVDTSSIDRLGSTFLSWNRIPDINIDHHISNTSFAKTNIIDPQSPATAQLIYEIIVNLSWPINPAIASNLFVGIITDTGSFRFRQTTERTFSIAAALVDAGACPSTLAEHCFHSQPISKFKLQQEAISRAEFYFNNKVACCQITQDMFQRHNALPEHTENILEPIQSIKDVEVAFVIESGVDKLLRCSIRSRGRIDASAIASKLGGGGHPTASGLRIQSTPDRLKNDLLNLLAPFFTPTPNH